MAETNIIDVPVNVFGDGEARPAFVALRTYLFAHLTALSKTSVSKTNRAADKLLRSAGATFLRENFDGAAEMFSLAAELDNANEFAFLGASLASLECNRYRVVSRYMSQARTLNQFVGSGTQLAAYDTMIRALDGLPASDGNDEFRNPVRPRDEADVWYRSKARRHPKRTTLRDLASFDEFFFDGLAPATPIILLSDRIATIGSCFAAHLSASLANRTGAKVNWSDSADNHLFVNDVFFTSYILREAFEYAFGSDDRRAHWYTGSDGSAEKNSVRNARELAYSVEGVRRALEFGGAYIITIGLAEIWYNKRTGEVYPSGINISAFDSEIHGFRVSTVEENFENLREILNIIRINRGSVPVIFTLSPVPLASTFRDINCVAANSVSKAILRLAIDRLMETNPNDENLFYFPSYEIVRDYFVDAFMSDMRHVKPNIVSFVVEQFYRKFVIVSDDERPG